MRYEGNLYRPPSEAYSLILQATIGCSHNKCTYCSMFKDKQFKIRKLEDLFQDLELARRQYPYIRKIFLADADAFIMKSSTLKSLLIKINILFPECEHVTSYSTAGDVLRKKPEELIELRKLGLSMLYIGIESGNDKILKSVKKGNTAQEMIDACLMAKNAGIKLSVTLISGLGGKKHTEAHALDSAKLINRIDPEYLGLLTLTIDSGTEMLENVNRGDLTTLTPLEVLIENRLIIENLHLSNCILRSNHVCNYVALAATLGKEKDRLLKELDSLIG